MKKNGLVLLLCTALLLPAAGCTSTPSQPSETGGAQPSAPIETIKIGLYGPLTGQHVISGEAMVQGAELGIEEINANGGLLGRQLELITYDDKSQPETAVQGVTKLTEVNKVSLLLASIHSGNILASADIVEDAKVPELGLGTSPSWLDGTKEYLFRVLPSNTLTNEAIITAIQELDIQNIGILYRADEAGTTNNADFTSGCEAAGITVVGSEAYQPTDTDFTGQINKLMRAGMEGIMCFGTSSDPMAILTQIHQLGFEGKVFGPEIFSSGEVKKVAGEAAENVIFAAPYCAPQKLEWANSDREQAFLEKFVEKYGQMPKSDACYRTYDAMMIFQEVVNTVGSVDGPAVKDGIANLDGFEGLAGTFQFKTAAEEGQYGEGVLTCRTYVIENGRDIELTPEKLAEIYTAMH